MGTLRRVVYRALGGALVFATMAPVFGSVGDDSYPFSTYPMFASKRKAPRLAKAEARLKEGSWQAVSPRLIGSDEVMQAAALVKRAARNRERAGRLCESIWKAQKEGFVEVRIGWVQYDPISYFVDGPSPISRRTVARCGPDVKKKRPPRQKKKKADTQPQKQRGTL